MTPAEYKVLAQATLDLMALLAEHEKEGEVDEAIRNLEREGKIERIVTPGKEDRWKKIA